MAAHKDEHRDAYIAAIVGGIVLILILLWLYASPNVVSPAQAADATEPAGGGGDSVTYPGTQPISYNIPPFNAGPTNVGGTSIGGTTSVTGDGCCNQCGPLGGTYLNVDNFLAATG